MGLGPAWGDHGVRRRVVQGFGAAVWGMGSVWALDHSRGAQAGDVEPLRGVLAVGRPRVNRPLPRGAGAVRRACSGALVLYALEGVDVGRVLPRSSYASRWPGGGAAVTASNRRQARGGVLAHVTVGPPGSPVSVHIPSLEVSTDAGRI